MKNTMVMIKSKMMSENKIFENNIKTNVKSEKDEVCLNISINRLFNLLNNSKCELQSIK